MENIPAKPRPNSYRWNDKAFALLDLDAFFASVEQLEEPSYRGKAVIIGSLSRRGVVSTASYEARKFGVRSAMPAYQAHKLCPEAIWLQPRMELYKEHSARVMRLLESYTPYVQKLSIDEAFLDLSPGIYSDADPVATIKEIQNRIKDELGLSCSIGLSNNKACSKIAADKNKPFGLCIVYPGQEAEFLAPLALKELSGAGPKTRALLATYGIKTIGQLAQTDERVLSDLLGSLGATLKLRAQGLEKEALIIDEPIKSISHERTFSYDICDHKSLDIVLRSLIERVSRRLRKHGLKAGCVHIKLRYNLQESKSAQLSLEEASDDEQDFYKAASQLLKRTHPEGLAVRLLGFGLSHFSDKNEAPHSQQLNLFDTSSDRIYKQQRTKLSLARDKIKDKFGEDSIILGSELKYRQLFLQDEDSSLDL